MEKRIDDCLSIRNGHLFVEECDTTDLVKRFGSPIYVISENQLRRNIRSYQQAFAQRWPEGKVQILPAIKANWLLALRNILTQEGAGCDVFSPGELHAALQSGIAPELVSVNGGGKDRQHIRNSIEAGVRLTVDDIDELDLIDSIAGELNKNAKIRFRLRPDLPNLWKTTDFSLDMVPIDLGFQVYKNGIPTEHVITLGKRALSMKNVEVMGFHIHLGRHHSSLGTWKGLMKKYVALIARLKEEWGGYEPKEVDIGGGIASPRDPFGKGLYRSNRVLFALLWAGMGMLKIFGNNIRYKIISKAIHSLFGKATGYDRVAPPIEDYAEAITSTLRSEMRRHKINPEGITLQIEPGRSMYDNTGIHLASVLKTKSQQKPIEWNWVLLDTSWFFLTIGVVEYFRYNFIIANKTDAKPVKFGDIVGKTCSADRILPEVRFPELSPGDIVAILDTGGYQEASSANFNALPRPATILVCDDQAEIIRHAETIEDVFRRDVVPERLAGKIKEPV